MKLTSRTIAGIRTGHFSNTLLFLTKILNLEMIRHDREREFAQFKLPSGALLEVFGTKNLWHPFTEAPTWIVVIADVSYTEEERS